MKQIFIAGLLALSTAASASVLAAPGDMGKYHERHMQRMASELQLTDQQQQDKVGAILTDEQRSKWQEMREQRREKMKKHMQDRKDGKRGERNTPL